MKRSINWQITRCQLVVLCKCPVSRFHPPKAPQKHQVNLTCPCEVEFFGQHLRTSTGWGLQSIMALHLKKNPIWSPALVTASHKEGVGSAAFSLNYFKDRGKKQKWAPTQWSTVYLSPDFPPVCLVGVSFPLSLPPLLTSFHRVCQSWGCPAVQQV